MALFSHKIMVFTKEQKKEAYKKLSPEVQDFVMSNETTELIENYLKEADLSEEQSTDADSEILYAMYGLQTLSGAIENIAKLSGKNINDLSKLKTDLDNNIFKNIPNMVNRPEEKSEETTQKSSPQNNVGNSFEQIILNQARAMQPAREASAPENLPTADSATSYVEPQEEKKVIHNYIGENDPYREPLQ